MAILSVMQEPDLIMNRMFLLSNFNSWHVLLYDTVFKSQKAVQFFQTEVDVKAVFFKVYFEYNCKIV